MRDLSKTNIFLIGFMGAGKSSVAARLSEELRTPCLELDEIISEQVSMSVSKIFEHCGEEYFRDLESDAIADAAKLEGCIVSCGGGAVLRRKNVEMMKASGIIVLLTAHPKTILDRIKDNEDRPLLSRSNKSVEYISNMMDIRREQYEAAANVIIDTECKTIPEVCDELLRKVADA